MFTFGEEMEDDNIFFEIHCRDNVPGPLNSKTKGKDHHTSLFVMAFLNEPRNVEKIYNCTITSAKRTEKYYKNHGLPRLVVSYTKREQKTHRKMEKRNRKKLETDRVPKETVIPVGRKSSDPAVICIQAEPPNTGIVKNFDTRGPLKSVRGSWNKREHNSEIECNVTQASVIIELRDSGYTKQNVSLHNSKYIQTRIIHFKLCSNSPKLAFKSRLKSNFHRLWSDYSKKTSKNLFLVSKTPEGKIVCQIPGSFFGGIKKRKKRSTGGMSPEMMYSFIEQAVQPGGHISLKCSAAGDPMPKFNWKLDNDFLLTSTHRYSVGQYIDHSGFAVSHLNISGVRVEDGGLYECKAINVKGSVSHSARLNVYGPPYIRPMSTVHGVTGGSVKLLCPFYGYPISYVKWVSNGIDVSSDPRYRQEGGLLEITDLDSTRDTGSLTCSIGNPGGELARREINLLINSPPVLSPLSFPPTLKSGERAQISCTVISGDMPVYFTWLKDGGPISASMQIDERNSEFFSLLIIKSLSAVHSGSYTCISTNSAGKVNISGELIVKVPPYWNNEPQDVSILLGSPLTINCDARGYPEPKKTWSKQRNKDGRDFDHLPSVSGHRQTFSNGTLSFEGVKRQDEGVYRCAAENGIGAILYKNIFIDINEPARFETPSQNVTVKRKEPVTLVCDVLGDNPIRNIWTQNTMEINSNYRLKISDSKKETGLRSELAILKADRQDSGLYRCQASNTYGRSEQFIHLSVLEKPDPPRQVELIQVGSRSVALRWKRPFSGNSPILGYQLQYEVLATDTRESWTAANVINITVTNSSTQTEKSSSVGETYEQGLVNGLLPDTMYSMRMVAMNQIDSSVYSEVVMVKTHEEAPSEAPQNVRVQAGETGELLVSWQAPRVGSWHGALQGFTIHWTEVESGNNMHKSRTNSHFVQGSTSNKFSITGLGQFTKYRISVGANNRAGNGPLSVPVLAATKEGVPSSPPQAVRCTPLSSQSLKIEWTPPPTHHHGGNLLGYKILYKPLIDIYSEETTVSAEVKRTSSSETYLHALLKYTNYSIQVLAYTGAGDGMHSPAVFCTTDQDIPGVPADLKAISLNADAILLSWVPPKKPNGMILFYTLYYREAGSDEAPISRQISMQEAKMLNVTRLGGAAEVRGLREKRKYEFWLSASTVAGEGSSTSPVTETPSAKAGARIASFGSVVRSGAGRPLVLGCLAAGNPSPRVSWMHSKKAISHGHQYRVTQEGNLMIHSVDEDVSGNYTCSAKNLFGSDEITYQVVCLLPPEPPALQLLYTTTSSAQLQWTPPTDGGSPILGYTLSFKRSEESVQVMELSPEVTSYKLDGLKCGSKYSFQIASYNRVGKGEFSQPIQSITKGEAPTFPKDWSHLMNSNATSIEVNIQRALNSNDGSICPLLTLTAEWRKEESGGTGTWNLVNVHSKEPLVITSLESAQWYQIRISAENHAGKGETKLRAATTTLSGAFLSSASYIPVPSNPVDYDGSQDNIFNVISITLATLAAISTLSVIYLLVAKRSVICNCSNQSEYGGDRQRSQSQASDEKTICAEQQNMRNCQHDYSTSPIKSPPEKLRGNSEDMYEISPYATFQVGGQQRQGPTSTLDHTLQFRTFGHMDNDASPSTCKRHYPQKTHRYTRSKGSISEDERMDAGCELLQPLRVRGRGRGRQGSGPSYCVPLPTQDGFQAVMHGNKSDMC